MTDQRRLGALYDALEFLATLREPEESKIWALMLEKTAAALGAEAAAHYSFDPASRLLDPVHFLGGAPGASAGVPVGSGLIGWVAKFHEPVLASDAARDERYDEKTDRIPGAESRSLLIIPVFLGLDFSGVFEFADRKGGPFTEEDRKLAQALARETSQAIRRLQLENMVNRVTTYNASILDNLSGGFLAVDLLGRVMICNPAARRILGIQGEATDVPVEKALTEAPELAAVLRETLSSKKTVKREEVRCQREGRERLLGYSTLLIKDTHGTFAGAGVTFQDITNIKR